MPVANKTADKYLNEDVVASISEDIEDNDELFEEETESVVVGSPLAIQSGWEAVTRKTQSADRTYVKDFRFTEEPQLVKFMDADPFAVFFQHWIQRPGRKSFISPAGPSGDPSLDPLIAAGNKPTKKAAFDVINFSMDEPTQQMLVATASTLGTQLALLNDDAKTGPLDRLFWALSKSGSGTTISYNLIPVKPRDLADDWGIDPEEAENIVSRFTAQTAADLNPATYEQLLEIAREIPA